MIARLKVIDDKYVFEFNQAYLQAVIDKEPKALLIHEKIMPTKLQRGVEFRWVEGEEAIAAA